MMTVFLMTLLFGYIFFLFFVRFLTHQKIQQSIRTEGPVAHQSKSGTPTMGGLGIIGIVLIAMLSLPSSITPTLWLLLFLLISYGAIGVVDDGLIAIKKTNKGLKSRTKFLLQILVACVFVVMMLYFQFRQLIPQGFDAWPTMHPWVYALFVVFILVGSSNAVNLTDGLDGLAAGTAIITLTGFLVIAFFMGEESIITFLVILIAAILAFFWFNVHPAKIFMGDTGSLAIGGVIGGLAILLHHEFLLILLGGVFVLETLSVIMQVISFKLWKKRIFRMSPLHHHFELLGFSEVNIVVKFWLVQLVFVVIALAL